ncbi:MAG TPA: murein transglycosylase A [Thermoanaerobaculia bacterium]|jgi:membrane-bound lytic murein transglycosylase A|nr:murein transglycosylase A [Thermoanaerobaculia bacterium]
MSRRTLAASVLLIALIALSLWMLRRPPGERQDGRVLTPATFADMPGWEEDDPSAALSAFRRSCRRMKGPICEAAARATSARTFFETHFQPFAVSSGDDPEGLFTGYYEPLLQGSRKRSERYRVPLYIRPPDLVMVDLGDFREELKGQRIAGRVEEGDLVPYPDRTAIEKGALSGRELELVWVDDPVDAFFLQIQGSGRVRLDDGSDAGSEMRVGYAAQNGHPYFAIGKDLVERGAMPKEQVSMQSIRRWLEQNPDLADDVMARNASYVFFEELKGEGPLGAQGVALTPGRSLAVDLKHWTLGTPVWLDAQAPSPRAGEPDRPLRRLMIAQDTGGAIRGVVRGDVFWGHGEKAAEIAGRMKHPGRMWVLLPRNPERLR